MQSEDKIQLDIYNIRHATMFKTAQTVSFVRSIPFFFHTDEMIPMAVFNGTREAIRLEITNV